MNEPESKAFRRAVLAAVAVIAVALAVPRLAHGLWLDETGTYWVVKDGLHDAFDRAIRYQGQSPLYYLVAWLALRVGGPHESVLRLPSTLAVLGAIALLHRLARRIFDPETALLSLVFFTAAIAAEAANARPYALALLFIVAAMLSLVRFLESGALRDGVLYALFAALTVYAHYLCGVMFLVHFFYALERRGAVSTARIALAFGLAFLLLIPLAGQFATLFGRRATLVCSPPPTLLDLLEVLLPLWIPAGALAGALIGARRERVSLALPANPALIGAVALWHALPIAVIWALSTFTEVRLFLPRYFIASTPGLALLAAALVRSFEPARTRRLVALACGILAFTIGAQEVHIDLELVAEAARAQLDGSTTPVFVQSGFVESMQLEWFRDPEKRSYLVAPLARYPIGGDVVALPQHFTEENVGFLASAVAAKLPGARKVVLFAPWPSDYPAWFEGRLAPEGFTRRDVGAEGRPAVMVFERSRER